MRFLTFVFLAGCGSAIEASNTAPIVTPDGGVSPIDASAGVNREIVPTSSDGGAPDSAYDASPDVATIAADTGPDTAAYDSCKAQMCAKPTVCGALAPWGNCDNQQVVCSDVCPQGQRCGDNEPNHCGSACAAVHGFESMCSLAPIQPPGGITLWATDGSCIGLPYKANANGTFTFRPNQQTDCVRTSYAGQWLLCCP